MPRSPKYVQIVSRVAGYRPGDIVETAADPRLAVALAAGYAVKVDARKVDPDEVEPEPEADSEPEVESET